MIVAIRTPFERRGSMIFSPAQRSSRVSIAGVQFYDRVATGCRDAKIKRLQPKAIAQIGKVEGKHRRAELITSRSISIRRPASAWNKVKGVIWAIDAMIDPPT